MFEQDRIVSLLLKWLNKDELTKQEKEELNNWKSESSFNRQFFEDLKDEEKLGQELKKMMAFDYQSVWQRIFLGLQQEKSKVPTSFTRFLMQFAAEVAFSIILILSFFVSIPRSGFSKYIPVDAKPVIAKHDAILTLPDGREVPLISPIIKNIMTAGGTNLKYLLRNDREALLQTGQYRVSTRRGANPFEITLPDGTKALLNAASSIRFPSTFDGKRRLVEISGEVFFEIAKYNSWPFDVVSFGNQKLTQDTVKVPVSRININAFENKAGAKVTLLEELATTRDEYWNGSLTDSLRTIISWKYGFVSSGRTDVYGMMRQLALYYDIDVIYIDKIVTKRFFTYSFPKDTPLRQILKGFEYSRQAHFKIEGNKVFVSAYG